MKRSQFNLIFFKRFWKVLMIIFPRWINPSVLLFVMLLCIIFLEQYLIFRVGMIPSGYYKVLGDKDLSRFKTNTIIAVVTILAMAFTVATKKYVCNVFSIHTRGLLTRHLHSRYFTDIIYYYLNVLDSTIDNADQRISEDVGKLCKTFSEIIANLMISPFAIAYYTYYTWASMGYIGPVCVVIFFIISTTINKFIMSPVVALVFRQEKLEGDFRFKHMQMRSNSESAAFYRCGNLELKKTNQKLKELLNTQQHLNLAQYGLQFSISIADYIGSILSYIILAIPIFSGKYDDLTPSELSALISKNAFVTIYLIFCFTRLIDMALNVSDMAGTTHRIIQLEEKLSKLQSQSINQNNILSCNSVSSQFIPESVTVAYVVDNLSFSAPNETNRLLVNNLSFQLTKGINILVTGNSGCGKSSLLRILDQLWPHSKGSVVQNVLHGYRGVFYLPQKPYLTDGTLRQQITFPYLSQNSKNVDDNKIIEYLREVDLGHLLMRTGGLDCAATWNWYDMLSPGEMQRLSFVRLFYNQPSFAVLDEATSQVNLEMEHLLYTTCGRLKMTLLSVGHRSSLRQYHEMQLQLEDGGDWMMKNITRL